MKRIAALLLALILLIPMSAAVALEITEDHFPGYYVEMHTKYYDVLKMATQAKWNRSPAVVPDSSLAITLDKRKVTPERGEIQGILLLIQGNNENGTVSGYRYTLKFSRSEMSDVLTENQDWLEEHFGASPVGKGQHLLMLGDDLVEVSVYQHKNKPGVIIFDMILAEDVDQALATYAYQSLEEVPVAPWKPIGIPPEEP